MPDVATVGAFLDDRHRALAAEAERFARERILPLPAEHDDAAARRQARRILGLLGRSGLCRHAVPAAWGGSADGPDLRALCLVREALAAASPLADSVFALQALGSMPVTLAGSDAQRDRVLPRVVAGEWMAAFAMTEPEAGSDVAAIATRARRGPDGDGWVLDGAKHLITNAGEADVYCVFARTAPDAGHRGLSCFLVEATNPGLVFVGPQVVSEPHPLGEIAFRDCHVDADALVGEAGRGFHLGMATLDRLRPTVAAAACGMAARALEEAVAHVRRRHQFGRPLAELQLVQEKLGRMATDLAAARLLVYRAAAAADAGAPRITTEAAMAKLFATEAAQRIVDDAVQLHGGRGVLRDSMVDRLYRAVRALRIYEGTSEVQHLVVARSLLG